MFTFHLYLTCNKSRIDGVDFEALKCRKSSKQWSNVEWNQCVERKEEEDEEEILHYDKERGERRVDARAGLKR